MIFNSLSNIVMIFTQSTTYFSVSNCISYIPVNLKIRPLVFSFELFYIIISGPFIADYTVLTWLIVDGPTVTYIVNFCVILVSCRELSLAIIPHLLFFILKLQKLQKQKQESSWHNFLEFLVLNALQLRTCLAF